ncbi:hypothetical protein C1645_811904 [Glomus cerebriforme]|uniref:Replication origin-binding protein domain-containing protein n=1 Tax=Glomus cerebriforme TaxID=658196 RepID=A0A397TRR0_9GLOM|nr:hypothetical protein C1645_811904 [Glomus cerebriforme]
MNPELPSLDGSKISREDLLSKILITCADILYFNLKHFAILDAFALASSSNSDKFADRVGKPYSEFIDLGLYKSRFSLQLLESAKEDRVKRSAVSSVKQGYQNDEFQPIEDETALSKGAGLVTAKYEWLEIGHIRKGFVNFQANNGHFVLKCYRQNQYKPDHKGLAFGKVTKISAKPKRGIVERLGDAILNPRSLVKLSEMMINVEKLKDAPEVYPNFLDIEKITTLIHSPPRTWKTTTLRENIMALKDKVESLFRVEFTVRPFVAILDEVNAIMRQMSSSTNARESENAMRDVLRSARHVLAIDAFANISTLTFLQIYRNKNICVVNNKYQPRIGETVEFIYDLNSGAEAMRIGYDLLRQGKRVVFVSTGAVMARVLVEKASKLSKPDNSPIRARAYYGDIDGKQRQKDFSDINVTWSELDCIAYTNTVEVGISFEVTDHFDIVIAITNIATPVHVEALAQMLYRIRDCPCRIVSIFYQKNSNELFRPLGHENIRAELESARPNNLFTAIKGHREWDNNAISYKIDKSPAVITFIEVEHQKRLSARYFIKKLCSLIAIEALVIKETDFNAVATSQNLSLEEAEVLKFDQERSIADTMALKHFYISPETQKHFLRLSYFRRQGFTGIDDKRILPGNISHAKTTPDLNSAIKAINAIASNWCGYTIKSDKKRIGSKGQQVKQYSYRINHQPYNSTGFGDKSAPELSPYRSKPDNDIQELFDFIGQDK